MSRRHSHRCVPLYGTFGDVIMMFASYSCSKRWLNTSICSRPRKPSRQPWPSAGLESRLTETLESFSINLSNAVFNDGNSDWSVGNTPANTYNNTYTTWWRTLFCYITVNSAYVKSSSNWQFYSSWAIIRHSLYWLLGIVMH